MNVKILVIGLGPYSVFTHLKNLLSDKIKPIAIVELESRAAGAKIILQTLNLSDVEIITVPDTGRDALSLDVKLTQKFDHMIQNKEISHVLISTEPKAHYSYLSYFLRQRIPIFCDKPILALKGFSTDLKVTRKSREQYEELKKLSQDLAVPVYINMKRRSHAGYRFIRDLVENISLTYRLAPTSLEVSASDGMWNFPNEFLSRENHPYKYGYGKLLHSGYHFVDLISFLIEKPLQQIHGHKIFIDAKSFGVRPNDFMETLNAQFYEQFFQGYDFQNDIQEAQKITSYGELDIFSNLRIMNAHKVPVTHVSLNLMNTSFSRRSWQHLPFDTYKANGRVRHERMSLTIGPLFNIQFHEYGTLEPDDRGGPYPVSEILVFRNTALIGGDAFQRIPTKDLEGASEKTEEQIALKEFIHLKPSSSMIWDHQWSQELLFKIGESLVIDEQEQINKASLS